MNIGDKFGRWTVVALIPHKKNPTAKCVCDCGSIGYPQRGALRFGKSKSCGCLQKELLARSAKTHGMSGAKVYKVWQHMIDRCSNPRCAEYKNYGARGIRVEWDSFESFFEDMGEPPRGGLIERLNNNGNYSKENCVWAGWGAQSTNKRTSRAWVVNGIEYPSSSVAAEKLGVDPSTINAWCRGRKAGGKNYPPKPGCSSHLKYGYEPGLPRWEPVREQKLCAKSAAKTTGKQMAASSVL